MTRSILGKGSLLLIVVFAFISCKKDQALINKIEGNYRIEKLITIKDGLETEVNYANSVIVFDDCTLKKQVVQQCPGYYEIEGQSRISFDYRPDKVNGKETMQINIGDLRLTPYLGGSFEIKDRTENSLTLIGSTENIQGKAIVYLKK